MGFCGGNSNILFQFLLLTLFSGGGNNNCCTSDYNCGCGCNG
jgi:hypothetical protein